MDAFNILFTSAGRRVALIQSFKKVLSNLGVPGIIVTTDSQKNAPAAFAADVSEIVPRINDANYINILLGICQKHQIKLLISLIDPELYLLSLHRQKFESKGVTLLVCSPETNEICYDKRNIFKFFKDSGVPTPELLDGDKILADPNACYPCNKVEALHITNSCDTIVDSDEYGRENWKCSPVPYLKVMEFKGFQGSKCVCVGDNPHKDLVTANKLSLLTV